MKLNLAFPADSDSKPIIQPKANAHADMFAREQLKAFLQTHIEYEHTFFCNKDDGKKIIRRIRVRLSRLRNMAKNNKMKIKHFKLIVVSIVPAQEVGKEMVTIKKSVKGISAISNYMADIADLVV